MHVLERYCCSIPRASICTHHSLPYVVETMFLNAWKPPTSRRQPVPTIVKVYSIAMDDGKYDRYRYALTFSDNKTLNLNRRSEVGGKESAFWHGTLRECNVGEYGAGDICQSLTCSLCRIIEHSFDITHANVGA